MGAGLGSQVHPRIFSYARKHFPKSRIIAVRPSITFPYEEDDDGEPTHAYHGYLGEEIGERIYTSIRGGNRVKELLPKLSQRRRPDVKNRATWTEVKFARVNSACQLRDFQMELYDRIQATLPQQRVELAIFRHRVDLIKTYPGKKADLFAELSKKILYAAELSYDLVRDLHKGVRGLTRPYTENEDPEPGTHVYGTCQCINVKTPHMFVEEAEDFLRMIGRNPTDYKIERQWSPELRLQGNYVKVFPMVRIIYKDVGDWAQEFAKEYWESRPETDEFDLGALVRLFPRHLRNGYNGDGHSRNGHRTIEDEVPF